MDTLALIVIIFFTCFILWTTTASLGFPKGTLVGVAVLTVIYGGYAIFFSSAFALLETLGLK